VYAYTYIYIYYAFYTLDIIIVHSLYYLILCLLQLLFALDNNNLLPVKTIIIVPVIIIIIFFLLFWGYRHGGTMEARAHGVTRSFYAAERATPVRKTILSRKRDIFLLLFKGTYQRAATIDMFIFYNVIWTVLAFFHAIIITILIFIKCREKRENTTFIPYCIF